MAPGPFSSGISILHLRYISVDPRAAEWVRAAQHAQGYPAHPYAGAAAAGWSTPGDGHPPAIPMDARHLHYNAQAKKDEMAKKSKNIVLQKLLYTLLK